MNAESLTQELRDLAASSKRDPQVTELILESFRELRDRGEAAGLRVGEKAPDFELAEVTSGEAVRLSEQLRGGPVVLVFYRGGWCPYCNLELRAYARALDQLQARGATVIAVSPEMAEDVSGSDNASLGFPVLADEACEVLSAFRVLFPVPAVALANFFPGTVEKLSRQPLEHVSLPVPATFVIDTDQIVRAAHVEMDYRTRMDPTEVLAIIDGL